MTDPSPLAPPRSRRSARVLAGVVIALLAVVIVLAVALVRGGGLVSEDEIRSAVRTGIEAEAAEGFVVTGRLSSTLAGSSARRRRLRVLNLEVGRSEVAVRVPATMTYGFSLDAFDADAIRFRDDGVVEVVLPPLSVFSVEPELEDAEVDIDVSGTSRLSPDLTERTIEQTLHRVRPALRAQAQAHLRDSQQPAVNSARALRRMLASPLEAAGVDLDAVRFRFVIAPGDTLDVTDGGQRRSVPVGDR